jgi:hypothetical protein
MEPKNREGFSVGFVIMDLVSAAPHLVLEIIAFVSFFVAAPSISIWIMFISGLFIVSCKPNGLGPTIVCSQNSSRNTPALLLYCSWEAKKNVLRKNDSIPM